MTGLPVELDGASTSQPGGVRAASDTRLPLRVLGRTGISVSVLGAGCWPIGGPDYNLGLPMGWADIDDATALTGLERAFELGVNLFDTADVYGHGRSERLIGKLVARAQRNAMVLTSKVGYFAGTAPHGYHPQHMRHQLEQSLDNLRIDHLDIYFFHNAEFGEDDRYLDGAVETMRTFKERGLVRAIGMRGPHRFALDRLTTGPELRGDKIARFRALFDIIQPDVLAVRDNLLTPSGRSEGIFALADQHDCGVLVNKSLAQGLLTGSYDPGRHRTFGPGDHRSRKRWFSPDTIPVLAAGIDRLRALVGPESTDLIRIALWACLTRSPRASVLVGFTSADQIAQSIECLGERPDDMTISSARRIMAEVQRELDTAGQVFVDEVASGDQNPA